MTVISDWDNNLVEHLRKITRELKFDWKNISIKLIEYKNNNNYCNTIEITPKICREKFAKDYSNNKSTNKSEAINIKKNNDIPKIPKASGLSNLHKVSNNLIDPRSTTTNSNKDIGTRENTAAIPVNNNITSNNEKKNVMPFDFDNLTLEQLIEQAEIREKNIQNRKEEIFKRVFSSLGGDNNDKGTLKVMDDAIKAYHESQQAKEYERLRREQVEEDAKEQKRLDEEREQLRRRFDGVDNDCSPSASGKHHEQCFDMTIMNQEHDDDIIPTTFVGEGATSLDALLGDESFDVFLSQLEKELDEQADGKQGHEVSSELADVLSILEIAAAESIRNPSTKELYPPLKPLTQPKKQVSMESKPSQLPQNAASKPSSNAFPQQQSKQPPKTKPIPQKQNVTVKIEDSESDNDSGNDSDDDWRAMRHKIHKKSAKIYAKAKDLTTEELITSQT